MKVIVMVIVIVIAPDPFYSLGGILQLLKAVTTENTENTEKTWDLGEAWFLQNR